MSNKTAIVIGHTALRQGACSPYSIPCEWEFNNEIASCLENEVDIYHYDSYNFGYTSMVQRNAKKLNKKDYKLVLELHYNAATPAANGCEALYYFKNSKGRQIAEHFCNLYTTRIGGKNRGAKALYSTAQRGFAAVYYPKATTLILEPFFGTNKDDVKRIISNMHKYPDIIRDVMEFSEIVDL